MLTSHLPSGWRMVPIKRFAHLRSGEGITSEEIEPVGDIPVFGGNGLRGFTDTHTHEGTHALIGRQGALCGNINVASGRFFASEHAVVVTPIIEAPMGWLSRLLHAARLGDLSQTAAQPGIAVSEIKNVLVPLPPVADRHAIADFLDRETAQIDAMIEAQKVLVEELRERRRAAVSSTLDSDLSLPRLTLRRLITGISQGWSPQCEDTPVDDPSIEWSVLKVGCVNGGVFRAQQNKMLPGDLEPRPELGLRAGDLLMSRGNTRELVGSAAVVDQDYPALMLSDLLYRVGLDHSLVSSEYVALALSTRKARDEIEMAAKGASHSMQKISQGDIRSTTIPLRSLQAQAEIVNEVSTMTVRTDAMISAAQEVVDLLRERREALITAAVTGRIDPATGVERIEEAA